MDKSLHQMRIQVEKMEEAERSKNVTQIDLAEEKNQSTTWISKWKSFLAGHLNLVSDPLSRLDIEEDNFDNLSTGS